MEFYWIESEFVLFRILFKKILHTFIVLVYYVTRTLIFGRGWLYEAIFGIDEEGVETREEIAGLAVAAANGFSIDNVPAGQPLPGAWNHVCWDYSLTADSYFNGTGHVADTS